VVPSTQARNSGESREGEKQYSHTQRKTERKPRKNYRSITLHRGYEVPGRGLKFYGFVPQWEYLE